MAQKLLRIIQLFSQNELNEFLKRNGYGEFEEVLIKGDIKNGKEFLDLSELQILKWGLPPKTKNKLLVFLKEIQQNPEQFCDTDTNNKQCSVYRRHSSGNKQDPFKEKLEQVFTQTKPQEIDITRKPTRPIPVAPRTTGKAQKCLPEPSSEEDSEPLEEYVDMDGTRRNNILKDEDDNEYLQPINPAEQEENQKKNYEPSPAEHSVTVSVPHRNRTRISQRPPLALPRESETGYIAGPDGFNTSVYRTRASPPQFSRLPDPKSTIEDENEETAYEPVDYCEENMETSSIHSESSSDNNVRRFFNFLKFNKKAETSPKQDTKMNSLDRKCRNKREEPPPLSRSLEGDISIRDRPLPPLPKKQQHFHTHNFNLPESVSSNLPRNTPQQADSCNAAHKWSKPQPPLPLKTAVEKKSAIDSGSVAARDEIVDYINSLQLQADNTSAADEEMSIDYINVTGAESLPFSGTFAMDGILAANPREVISSLDAQEEEMADRSKSYEMYAPKTPRNCKKALPLPPNNLPELMFDLSLLHEDEQNASLDEVNFNNYPFYRNTDRSGARLLLQDLGEGAFLFRPSRKFFLTLSLKHGNQYFNLGVEKSQNNKIRLHTADDSTSPEFVSLEEFVKHFTSDYLTFLHQDQTVALFLRPLLPLDRF